MQINDTGMDLKDVGLGYVDVDWINLAQDRNKWLTFVNAVMAFLIPQMEGNFLSS
jgi:hypothetical protein